MPKIIEFEQNLTEIWPKQNKVSFDDGIDNENNSITLYWGEGLEKTLKLKNKKDLAVEFVEEISNIYN